MSTVKGLVDTIAWYDANAKKYAKNIESYPNLDLIEAFVKKHQKNAHVLDAGCAGGRDSRILKDLGLSPVGVDISEALIAIAREKNPDIEFVIGNLLYLPFKNESFDGVWAHASLLHLASTKEVEQAISECARVLKKGGILHVFIKKQQGKIKTQVVKDSLSGGKRFFQFFTSDEIKSYLEKFGFKTITIRDDYNDIAGRGEVVWIHALAKKR